MTQTARGHPASDDRQWDGPAVLPRQCLKLARSARAKEHYAGLRSLHAKCVVGIGLARSRRFRGGRAFPAVIFGYLSVECPFNKIYGINRRPELDTKLLDRFFHWRWQISPPVNNA